MRQMFLQLPVCAHSRYVRYVCVRFVIRLLKRPASCVYVEDMLIWKEGKEGRLCFAHACEIMTAITEGRRLNYSRKKVREEDASSFPVSAFFFWAEKILRNKHLGINIKLKNIPSALLWKRPPPLFIEGGSLSLPPNLSPEIASSSIYLP